MPDLTRCDYDGCPLTAYSDQSASIVDGQRIGRLDGVKFLADEQVADAVRAQDRIVLASVVGLAWTDQPKAVEAVFGLGGYQRNGVSGKSLRHRYSPLQ